MRKFFKIGLLLLALSFIAVSCASGEKEPGVLEKEIGHSSIQVIGKLNPTIAVGRVKFNTPPLLTWEDKEGVVYYWTGETLVAYYSPEIEAKREAVRNAQNALIEAQREALRQQQAEQAKQKQKQPPKPEIDKK